MKKLTILLAGAAIGLIPAGFLYPAFHQLWIAAAGGAAGVAVALLLVSQFAPARRQAPLGRTVGVGTVRRIGGNTPATAIGERHIFVEVVAVSGETFIGKLARCEGDPEMALLRPGLVVLVAFDPAAREELSLPDDVLAVHASWLAAT